jgi:hypothetical protein
MGAVASARIDGPHPFRLAVEARDLDAMMATLSGSVALQSPAKFSPFEGQDEVRALLGIILEVLEDFRYTDEVRDGDVTVLIFRARVGDRELEGVDILRAGANGLVDELTVMMRPKSGLDAVIDEVTRRMLA